MSKKIWSMLSVLLIAMLVLAACSPAAPAAPATEEAPAAADLKGTITLWHSLKEGEIEGFNDVVTSFQAENPNVQFDVLYVPFDDLRGKFETAAATGGGPTLLVGAADWGPALYNAELVANVSDLASAEFLGGINQAAVASVQYKDALIGLPLGLKGVVMFRNATIVPEAPTSFDDLVAKATAATAGDVVGANLERGFFFSAGHLGSGLLNAAGDPTFSSDAGVAWLTMLNRFTEAGPAEYYTDNDVNLFKAGKAGIIIDGTWNLNDLANSIGPDNLKVDVWPAGMSGYVQNDNVYMGFNAEGDNKAATWAFMEYLLSADSQAKIAAKNTGFIPAALGVEVTDRLRQEAIAAFGGGAAFPVIPEMGAYWEAMDTALKSVFDEGADPAESLAAAFERVSAAIVDIRGQ